MAPARNDATPGETLGRVLIVDDQAVDRRVVRSVLARMGFECVEAGNAADAIERFAAVEPDFVILDIEMPGIDGVEACRRFKAAQGDRYVPVVFMTSSNAEDVLARCLEAGGDDFVAKPISAAWLVARLRAMARINQLRKQTLAQKTQIDAHRQALVQEQEDARVLFDRVVGGLQSRAGNVRTSLAASAVFNGDIVLTADKPAGGQHILVGDFTGHGLMAAIGALPVAEVFLRMTGAGADLCELVIEINRRLRKLLPTGRFLAAAFVELDVRMRRLRIYNCGLPDLLLLHRGASTVTLCPSLNLPLGVTDAFEPEDELHRVLEGDCLYAVSDGIVETTRADGRALGIDTLVRALVAAPDGRGYETVLETWAGACGPRRPLDDCTIVEIRCDAVAAAMALRQAGLSRCDAFVPWKWQASFDHEALKSMEPQSLLTSVAVKLLGSTDTHSSVPLVLSELFTNALDHGVLGLDSRLKATPEGFARYYEERTERLSSLSGGRIDVALSCVGDAERQTTSVLVRDSGRGFDASAVSPEAGAPFGRGLQIVRALGYRLEVRAGGTEVEAITDASYSPGRG